MGNMTRGEGRESGATLSGVADDSPGVSFAPVRSILGLAGVFRRVAALAQMRDQKRK